MDECHFWSCALGEWVRDCVCSTSSADPPIVAERNWRPTTQLELPLRYAELCDGVALNLVLCYIAANDSVGFLLVHPMDHLAMPSNNSVERSESLSSGVSSSNHLPSVPRLAPLPIRLRHFQHLINGLNSFYRSRSLLIVSLPDVLSIAKFPVPEISGHEMHKLLALLLGAAVHSSQREHFIERIQRMRPELQAQLAEEIQRVTSNANSPNSPVLNLDSILASSNLSENNQQEEGQQVAEQQIVAAMLERALRERDEFANGMLEMAQEMEPEENGIGGAVNSAGSSSALTTASSSCNGDSIPPMMTSMAKAVVAKNGFENSAHRRSPSPNALDRHANVELAAAKAELRKLRNENEEKEELLLELQEELEGARAELGRLQGERLELVKDARAAKDLRDELDCMQHKLGRLERAEAEAEKLRARVAELDFYKSRVHNLKEDNQLMQETCRVMEEQLEQCQRKLTAHLEVETKLIESQGNIKSLQLDLTTTRERVEDLLVENGRLERELKANVQRHAELERQLCALGESPRGSVAASLNDSSLLAQLDAHNQSQMLELQLENRKLKARLQEGQSAPNPAEMFELKAELTAHEKAARERAEECTRVRSELEQARAEVRDAEEAVAKQRTEMHKMEKEWAEQRRALVPGKQYQNAVDQREKAEQRAKEAEMRAERSEDQLQTLQAEKRDLDVQLARVRAQYRDACDEADALHEARQQAQDAWADERRQLEGERAALRAQLDSNARELDAQKRSAENAARRAAGAERERDEHIQKINAEMEQLRQQMDIESRKAQRYREELLTEQNRLSDLLARLRALCLMAIGNDKSENGTASELSTRLADEDDAQLLATIDELLARALRDARREADALRVQQQRQIRELDALKADIQALRKRGHELNASDDSLLAENRHVKEQVNLLQERLQWAQNEESTRSAELQAAKREVEELQRKAFAHSRTSAELANAQLSLQARHAQEEQLRAECAGARAQLDAALKAHAETQKRLDSLELIHSALASDHDRLQNLHQMLSSDYDRIKREKECIRQKMKGEKTSTEQMLRAEFLHERNQLLQTLEEERAGRQREARRTSELEAEMARMGTELAELKAQHNSNLFRDEDSAAELRRLRLAECAQKSNIVSLNVMVQQLNNALTEKDLELANLRRQVEMLRQYSGEENRTLIRQIELLLVQNQQLHNRSDAFYAEQKELQEKLLTLRRHKEKLEEKIMEQYKHMDSRKLERPTLMKRAAKLISKSPSRKSSVAGRGAKDPMANSASDRSEDSSIYSTENESKMGPGNGGKQSTTPPPPCPNGNSKQSQQNESGHIYVADQLASRANSEFPSRCSTSVYSSINSNASYTRHHLQHNLGPLAPNIVGDRGCSIERRCPPPSHQSPLAAALRVRNGRLGGSLRCPSGPPAMMARSFPSPALAARWRRGVSVGASSDNGSVAGDCGKLPGDYGKLPACCKIIQEHDAAGAPALMDVEDNGQSGMSGIQLPPKFQQSPKPLHHRRMSELPPKMPQNSGLRPPPPPYPGAPTISYPTPSGGTYGMGRAASSPPVGYKLGIAPSVLGLRASPNSLPPRDTSTPKSLSSNASSPSQIHGGSSPGSSTISNVRNDGRPSPAAGDRLAPEGEFRDSVRDPAERAQKAASVYENVAGGAGDAGGHRGGARETAASESEAGGERRQGPGGEIWYEFGCV